jgi:hypothetical protein
MSKELNLLTIDDEEIARQLQEEELYTIRFPSVSENVSPPFTSPQHQIENDEEYAKRLQKKESWRRRPPHHEPLPPPISQTPPETVFCRCDLSLTLDLYVHSTN